MARAESYGDIARDTGAIESVRVVARYCGTNRFPVVIPCHRCIGSDGSLTGFGGGLWRKQKLIEIERSHAGAAANCDILQ